jgi:hypothetical protein
MEKVLLIRRKILLALAMERKSGHGAGTGNAATIREVT